ncbi:hypothetical protein D9758_012714 [Tetrapyrgos nigripes]|uniref:Uncharacterized protein n=1 Tax=Tetrapyrgos nigripes TaxID=182062 RepID=A0A8H5FUB5_9AGAR|nr:hypothetical protein D9758_012714 [Tetrapyrgos nigripes]
MRNLVIIQSTSPSTNPSPHFLSYLKSHDCNFPLHPELWIKADGKVPTCDWFIKRLKSILPNVNIAGHSLQSGGATSMAEAGVPPHLIQAARCWASYT